MAPRKLSGRIVPESREQRVTPERVLRAFFFIDIVSSSAIRDAYLQRHGGKQGNEKYREECLEGSAFQSRTE